MRLQELYKELQNKFKCEIKNSNEIYVEVNKDIIRDVVKDMFDKYKLYFVGEFCVDDRQNFIINITLSNRRNGYYVVLRYKTLDYIVSLQGLAH